MQPTTLATSFSFYVRETKPDLLLAAAGFGDAITIAGPRGPDVYRRSPDTVRIKPVLFDGASHSWHDVHMFWRCGVVVERCDTL